MAEKEIVCSPDPDTFVKIESYKENALRYNTHLSIPKGFQAVVYQGQKFLGLFRPETTSPLNKKRGLFFSKSFDPLKYKVYVVNMHKTFENKWGTIEPFDYYDVDIQKPLKLNVRGTYTFKVLDAKKMIERLKLETWVSLDTFHGIVQKQIESTVWKTIKPFLKNHGYFALNQEKETLAEQIGNNLKNIFSSELGTLLVKFEIKEIAARPEALIEAYRHTSNETGTHNKNE